MFHTLWCLGAQRKGMVIYMKKNERVSVIKTDCFCYPCGVENFRPSVQYPEYTGALSERGNRIYDGVREALYFLGLDADHFGTPAWNPLEEFIKPGMCVLIKPNLVMDTNAHPEGGTDCLYTQPSVVAPMIDYVLLALKGKGKIVIGDAPMQRCDFDNLVETSGYQELVEDYRARGIDIALVDMRGSSCQIENGVHISQAKKNANGTVIDLGEHSEFCYVAPEKLKRMRVTNYDPRRLQSHHQAQRHEYEISNYVLEADVIINMPKPKTHRKAGVTISLKNFVGVNVRKEFLPHHTMGASSQGGDEYDRKNAIHMLRSRMWDRICICEAERRYGTLWFYRGLSKVCSILLRLQHNRYSEGSWYGNRTISRTIADINKLVYYARKDGTLQDTSSRTVLIVADMIVSGEKEGPLAPSPKNVGIIAAGLNPVCFDEAIASLMGMDIDKIPTISTVRKIQDQYKLVENGVEPIFASNDPRFDGKRIQDLQREDLLHFVPTDGWKDHIERK